MHGNKKIEFGHTEKHFACYTNDASFFVFKIKKKEPLINFIFGSSKGDTIGTLFPPAGGKKVSL